MKFSDTTNKNGLIQDCEELLEMGDAAISGDTTLLKVFTHKINQAMLNEVIPTIIEMQAGWNWDDSNYTDFPRAVGNLVAGQGDYTLPIASGGADQETFLQLEDIGILDSNGDEYTLTPTIDQDAELNRLYETSGKPRLYKLNGKSIKMWPAPSSTDTTLSSGLIVYYQRTQDEFTTSDTTQQPGFATPFHRLLSIIACIDYAGTKKGLEHKLPALIEKRDKLIERLKQFYGKRNQEAKLGLDRPARVSFS